jgi:uroporphyrinogen decarboxylase
LSGDAFRAAIRLQPAPHTPVWFMRQAGRYMAEYRAIRAKASLLEICHRPELACEVTLQPVEHLGVDAAIIFADILLPFEPLDLGLSFEAGEGPVIARPIRSAEQVARLRPLDPETDLGYVLDAIRLAVKALKGRVPLIGFAGAPFTLASYAIEGGSTRNFAETKRFMYREPRTWHALLDKLAVVVGNYLAAQGRAGAEVVQLFDSWVGCLSPDDYREYVLPHSRKALALAREGGAKLIHFGTDTATFLDAMAEAGGDVIGIDWRIGVADAWKLFPDRGVQGNLDPCLLFAPLGELKRRVNEILDQAAGRPGHIFNVGHGILPTTDPARVRDVVDMVHERVAARV